MIVLLTEIRILEYHFNELHNYYEDKFHTETLGPQW